MLKAEHAIKNQAGFIFLILFCAMRPLALLDTNISIFGFNMLELFTIIMSYLLLIPIALNFRKMKFDLISISIIWYCSLCFISISWGSDVRTISQVTLPFVLFFATRVTINKPEQIKLLLTVLLIFYCVPTFTSFYKIMLGTSNIFVENFTGIERQFGAFKRVHPFSYAMFFISVYFFLQVNVCQLRNRQIKLALIFLLIISIFCLFKTYTRNTFLGFISFWTISLWGYKKKYFFIVLILSLISGVLYLSDLQQIFFKAREFDANVASSGRIYLWTHDINLFLASSFDRQLFGHGLGVGATDVIGSYSDIWAPHNDFIQVLMALGGVGLVAYFLPFLALLKDVYISNINKGIKYFYYGIIFSMTLMNFGSGVTLYRVETSQQFWLIMGFLYIFRDFKTSSLQSI